MRLIRRLMMLGLVLWQGCTPAYAQTDPRTLPLADLSKVVEGPRFTYDWPDGSGRPAPAGDMSYGGGAMGVSEDGRFLYISCSQDMNGFAKLEIPTNGGMARVVAPCSGPNAAEIRKLHPDPNAFRPYLGGLLEQAGRVTVTAYISYDASNGTTASHWSGPTLQSLQGPFRGTVAPGMVKAHMGPVPAEWRALLGGPALSSAGYTSIISRASYGASVSVFDPATVTANNFPMTMLLGCPDAVAACRTYGTPTSNDYNGSELSGGFFIVPGTRTLVVIERESSGPTCYGYATRNQAEHGQPYLDAVKCYSLTDPLDQKGPKGYPYRLVAKLYDLNELVAVKQGAKKPWDVKQYATVDLPGSNPGEFINGGAYNPVRGEYYFSRYTGGGTNTVYTLRGFGAGAPPPPPPPAPVNCAGTWAETLSEPTPIACDATQQQTRTRTRTFTVVTPAANGGTACPASPVVTTETTPCVYVPPPPPPAATLVGRFASQATYSSGGVTGLRVTLRVPAAQARPAVGTPVTLRVPLVGGATETRPGTIRSTKANAYSGGDGQIVVELPGLGAIGLELALPVGLSLTGQ